MPHLYGIKTMMKIIKSSVVILCIVTAGILSCRAPGHVADPVPKRIVSLAPSITETLFALGLGERVIGVTAFCNYPQEALRIEKIGGYSDANIEKIVSLKPDLIIASIEHARRMSSLQQIGVSLLIVDYSSCNAICSSFVIIGKRCNVQKKADSLAMNFRSKLIPDEKSIGARPQVMICVGRDNPGDGTIRSVYAAGAATVFDELIRAAGGENAVKVRKPEYPRLSPEGIMTLNPDIIIDIASSMSDYNCETLVKDWYSMDILSAVKSGNVKCISADYATVPGPRLVYLIDDLRAIIAEYNATQKETVTSK